MIIMIYTCFTGITTVKTVSVYNKAQVISFD